MSWGMSLQWINFVCLPIALSLIFYHCFGHSSSPDEWLSLTPVADANDAVDDAADAVDDQIYDNCDYQGVLRQQLTKKGTRFNC